MLQLYEKLVYKVNYPWWRVKVIQNYVCKKEYAQLWKSHPMKILWVTHYDNSSVNKLHKDHMVLMKKNIKIRSIS